MDLQSFGFSSKFVNVVDELTQGLRNDQALGVCVRSCAVKPIIVKVQLNNLSVFVFVKTVGIRNLCGHIFLVPTSLLDDIFQHLVDNVSLLGSLGFNLFHELFKLSILFLVLSKQFLCFLVEVSALVRVILNLQIFNLQILSLKKPVSR